MCSAVVTMFLPLLNLCTGTGSVSEDDRVCDTSLSKSEPCGVSKVLNAGVVCRSREGMRRARGVSNASSRLVVLPSVGRVAAVAAVVYAEAMAARARAVVREGGSAGGRGSWEMEATEKRVRAVARWRGRLYSSWRWDVLTIAREWVTRQEVVDSVCPKTRRERVSGNHLTAAATRSSPLQVVAAHVDEGLFVRSFSAVRGGITASDGSERAAWSGSRAVAGTTPRTAADEAEGVAAGGAKTSVGEAEATGAAVRETTTGAATEDVEAVGNAGAETGSAEAVADAGGEETSEGTAADETGAATGDVEAVAGNASDTYS
ncbi:hypothetical protein F5148DRAFT_1150044 [Russula earlei]|uniref:Uncharacterized protein n=1 Tax=Russula earlei TaxID=71964 RepID=A0ACC0U6C5_9AGAM|nr:hypothetical protein F5148DRAFT_1150044 [Russula earlei]